MARFGGRGDSAHAPKSVKFIRIINWKFINSKSQVQCLPKSKLRCTSLVTIKIMLVSLFVADTEKLVTLPVEIIMIYLAESGYIGERYSCANNCACYWIETLTLTMNFTRKLRRSFSVIVETMVAMDADMTTGNATNDRKFQSESHRHLLT